MLQTNNLNTILLYAQQEAQRLGNSEVLPDHLMLGILRLANGKAFELLMQAGMDPVECKQAPTKHKRCRALACAYCD